MSAELSLSRLHFPVTALGPGRRLGIWLQGCSIRCPGCISADTWGPGRRRIAITTLIDDVAPWLDRADGITISGGEPFDQWPALAELLRALRQRGSGDILVYSGYDFADVRSRLAEAPGLIDALISGPYRQDLPQTLPLRGSDNQRLHRLTPLGHLRYAALDAPSQDTTPSLDLMFDRDGSAWMAGIPRRGDLQRLQALLTAAGHDARTSQHRHGGSA